MEPTDIQKQIIDYSGNAVVLASPGSGKTFVLSHKIRNVLTNESMPTYQGVIAISYTRKASSNLQRRTLEDGSYAKNSFFGTIDNFCLTQIILPFASHIIGSPHKELDIISIKELTGYSECDYRWINELHPDYEKLTQTQLYNIARLFSDGYLLVESLELLGLHVMKNCVACQNYLRARFRYVFIDEYQDADTYTNGIFLTLIGLGLIGVAVGDINQSIFGFAHKDSRYLKELEHTTGFRTFKLNRNFRCSPSIVNYSNRLLNKDCELFQTDDKRVILARIEGDESSIAEFIDKNITKLCECLDIKKLCDVAILVKNGRTQNLINKKLATKHRVIETTILDVDLNPRSHLYAQLLLFYFDKRASFLNILDGYLDYELLSISTKNKLNRLRESIRNVKDVNLIKLPDYFQKVADIVLPKIDERESLNKLNQVIGHAEWIKAYYPVKDDEIQIMTLHKSKGLEFDLVLHLNMNEWELPVKIVNNGDFDHPEFPSWEQDLNLHYVGITRARQACVLLRSSKRTNGNNQTKQAKDSEFLSINGVESLRREIAIL